MFLLNGFSRSVGQAVDFKSKVSSFNNFRDTH
jgi:hypothetical protein